MSYTCAQPILSIDSLHCSAYTVGALVGTVALYAGANMQATQFKEPIDLITGDQPNVCPFDGSRVRLLEVRDEHTVEQCPMCKRVFNFWED